jgi:hypothetical protein
MTPHRADAPKLHKVQLYLPEPLWLHVQARAKVTGRTVTEIVREAISDKFIPQENGGRG